MFRLGIRNLRRLRDFPAIEIKPFTLLVGRNSSGKSTFLRTLPLLRQSVTTRTSSPILWYGDWVDFGDFEGAIFDHNSSNKMTFTFGIDRIETEGEVHIIDDDLINTPAQEYNDVSLEIEICKEGSGTRIHTLALREHVNNATYDVKVASDGEVTSLRIDGTEMKTYLEGFRVVVPGGSIFPLLYVLRRSQPEGQSVGYLVPPSRSILNSQLRELLLSRLDPRIKVPSFEMLVNKLASLTVISKESFRLSSEFEGSKSSWKKLIKDITTEDRDGIFEKLRLILLLSRFPVLLRQTSSRLKSMTMSTLYIGPARAKSDRYYRYQDLSVSEIDPDGKNFPMFLNSLSSPQLRNFSEWVKSLFGYGVNVSRESGHISIELVYASGPVNVVDTGYGVSQILPVLGQVWWANNRDRYRPRGRQEEQAQIIAIEQPELHLHPAHQALLTDAFVGTLKDKARRRGEIYFIIETHSETLINRLGTLIAESEIDASDVQIIIFDVSDDSADTTTEARVANFNSEGELIDWPYGFFTPKAP